jgi:hypothetical protein
MSCFDGQFVECELENKVEECEGGRESSGDVEGGHPFILPSYVVSFPGDCSKICSTSDSGR